MKRFWLSVGARVAPFVALLDARYLPLLFAAAPQAYAVYAWLKRSGAPESIAVLGGAGYEMVYVGAIAWAEDDAATIWTWITAVTSLLFAASVAVSFHWGQPDAWLHIGFPLVAFSYTLQMFTSQAKKRRGMSETATRAARNDVTRYALEAETLGAQLSLKQQELETALRQFETTRADREALVARLETARNERAALLKQLETVRADRETLTAQLETIKRQPLQIAVTGETEMLEIGGKRFSYATLAERLGLDKSAVYRKLKQEA